MGGGPTVTVTERVIEPLAPLQVNTNVLLVVSVPVAWLPDTSCAPDQAPEAVQEDTLLEDQNSVVDAPFAIDDGFAVNDNVGELVGGGGGGGVVPGALGVPPSLVVVAPPQPLASATTIKAVAQQTPRGIIILTSRYPLNRARAIRPCHK